MSDRYSFLNDIHNIEFLYKKYKENPNSIEPSWCAFFYGFDFNKESCQIFHEKNNETSIEDIHKEFSVYNLVQAYRKRGHLFTETNPILKRRKHFPTLDLKNFGLSEKELDLSFEAGKLIGIGKTTLRKIIDHLKSIYCNSIGIEYMYISDPKKIEWIENWFTRKKLEFSKEKRKFFLQKLNEAVAFENFIHTKFVGKKRFSIEGNESLLPALEEMIEYTSNKYLTEDFVIGMSHRGRLNILSNFFRKNYSNIFSEFQEKKYKEESFSGDVKYHLGFTKFRKTCKGRYIKMSLVPNPSHLESVNPIVEGITRSKIDINYNGNSDSKKIIPILIHGDAALSGQGIVYEVIQLSKLKGYKTGGTIHIVINNQIGFTTNYTEGRSSIYCTDIAKVLLSPVLHINADDIESVIRAIHFAVDFRMHYHEDVFIDLLGYRKYGHNEGDEPRFTQPTLYKVISKHTNSYNLYKRKLEKEGTINSIFIQKMEKKYEDILNRGYEEAKTMKWNVINSFLKEEWKNFPIINNNEIFQKVNTQFPINRLIEIANRIFTLPMDKKFFSKTKFIFKKRLEMVKNQLLDWSMAELLSYGTLLDEGYHIRLSGEDVARGTFSQRHAILKTEEDEEIISLNNIRVGQGKMQVYNSPLSEYGVLGFDYGYAMFSPYTLTLWEAQFGDFGNGGQIIIDQYISSGEDKWKIRNGMVMLLPHGYEGQGPEHSSARIERYLQLCANNNLFIVNCTTPANFYHLLRRQMKLKFRKPLLVFTPKSLLRHIKCKSTMKELSEGEFQEILDDVSVIDVDKVTRLIFCSGKIYYDLLNKKESIKDEKTALIRIEQIYPLKEKKIIELFNKYKNKKIVLWVQEEPENMGLWSFILRKISSISFNLIAPSERSSPSTGSYTNFLKIQNKILDRAFIS
ncbi:MAG: 2-oxoglutarate dehydrogenase E1 component [Flavobacteriales bacterium]|jgi:2-oxoglutarate dehydrogenase E1 component|uniref:2-oxoglutarate dehydrogenase E1 component n=1 Tax=Blattabacterium sp. (Mastotermes darwiniensis) TaxID=39768 RepID=UPI000231DF56|nr:2-oxoglutarate dehydrogenase E1 component [Blattabacterium sp. (Mastotermes darwiniensis)]AER40366.1 2-oxoglutarate dehydrogenase, E1 component [Blattabacterium sp. (Mastotermes darwiniensis) str. MADAR]MDR1804913.1 2-oxoglutarate dehydrogenase E1 component [Flavobacteriales bacterium]